MDVAFLPRFVLTRLCSDSKRSSHLNVFLSTSLLLIAAGVTAYQPSILSAMPHICLVQSLLGIPCPGCGVTRSALALCRGDLPAALAANSAGPVVVLATLFQVPLRLFACRGASDALVDRLSRLVSSTALASLFVNWLSRLVY